jgi:hypothetical protein
MSAFEVGEGSTQPSPTGVPASAPQQQEGAQLQSGAERTAEERAQALLLKSSSKKVGFVQEGGNEGLRWGNLTPVCMPRGHHC